MLDYFFALMAPIVLIPLIPFFGRLIGMWWVNRPDADRKAELAARLREFRKSQGQRGMTLAEILVAMCILMIGIMALLSVIPYAANNIQIGNTVTTGTFLANARIEAAKDAATYAPAQYAKDATGALVTPLVVVVPEKLGYKATYVTVGTYVDAAGNVHDIDQCSGIINDPVTPLAGTESDVSVNGYQTTGYSRTTLVETEAGACPSKTVTVTVNYRGKPQSMVTLKVAPR